MTTNQKVSKNILALCISNQNLKGKRMYIIFKYTNCAKVKKETQMSFDSKLCPGHCQWQCSGGWSSTKVVPALF